MVYKKFRMIIGITTACFFMVFNLNAFSQTVFKIGVVDTQRVLDEYKKAKEANNILKTAIDRLRSELEQMDNKRSQMIEKLDKQRLFLEDSQKEAQMRNEIRLKEAEISDRAKKGQNAIEEKRKELLEPILKEMDELIGKIGKEENFSMILEKNLVTLYVDPKYDLTDRVIKILNDRYDKENPEQKKKTSKEGTGGAKGGRRKAESGKKEGPKKK